MLKKYFFYFQILVFLLVVYFIKEYCNQDDEKFSYYPFHQNLEECLAMNIPCPFYKPDFWEIQNLPNISFKEAKKIKKITDKGILNKEDFINELMKIRGIGEKKANKIAKIFFY